MLGYIISDKVEINVENYEIQPFEILKYTDLNIFVIENNKVLYVNDIIICACKYGHIQVLEWFKNSGYKFKYNETPINYASKNGHIQVLEWFKNSGYEFKYSNNAINYASENGQIQVLEWFKNSGYEFKYDKDTIIYKVPKFGHIQVLEWFKNSGYEFKYDENAIDYASSFGNVQVLEQQYNEHPNSYSGGFYFTIGEFIHLFHNYGCNLRIVEIPENENFKMVKISDNFKANMIIFKEKYDLKNLKIVNVEKLLNIDKNLLELCILIASKYGIVEILEWFKNSDYEFKYTENAINKASQYGHIQVLEWFKNSGYEFKYDWWAINYASKN